MVYEEFETAESIWDAIKVMKVRRSTSAIGVTAAYGLYLGIRDATENSFEDFWKELKKVSDFLASSRPTAVKFILGIRKNGKSGNR